MEISEHQPVVRVILVLDANWKEIEIIVMTILLTDKDDSNLYDRNSTVSIHSQGL